MNGSDSDTEIEMNENERNSDGKFHSGFISGWENDTEDVEEQHPQGEYYRNAVFSSVLFLKRF